VTTAAIAITGNLAAIIGPALCKLFRLTDPVAQGVAYGTSGHVVGTSKASELGDLPAAAGSLSLVIAGILTAILFPLLTQLAG
jgi:putative effector of murein hydrolase